MVDHLGKLRIKKVLFETKSQMNLEKLGSYVVSTKVIYIVSR